MIFCSANHCSDNFTHSEEMQRSVTKTREVIAGHESKSWMTPERRVTKSVPSRAWNLDLAISRKESDLSFLSNKTTHIFLNVCLQPTQCVLREWQTPCRERYPIILLPLQLNRLKTLKSWEGINLKFSLQKWNLFEGSWQLVVQLWPASPWVPSSC